MPTAVRPLSPHTRLRSTDVRGPKTETPAWYVPLIWLSKMPAVRERALVGWGLEHTAVEHRLSSGHACVLAFLQFPAPSRPHAPAAGTPTSPAPATSTARDPVVMSLSSTPMRLNVLRWTTPAVASRVDWGGAWVPFSHFLSKRPGLGNKQLQQSDESQKDCAPRQATQTQRHTSLHQKKTL